VREGVNGHLAPIDDAEATATALGRALSRPDWDAQAISQGLEVGGWKDVAREVLDFFGESAAPGRVGS
jgi:hypothetical protein